MVRRRLLTTSTAGRAASYNSSTSAVDRGRVSVAVVRRTVWQMMMVKRLRLNWRCSWIELMMVVVAEMRLLLMLLLL